MKINADIGERGENHPVDILLMEWLDLANLACGGHAGDRASVASFRELASVHEVGVTAHLSYPDPEFFGRRTMTLSREALLASLDEQHALMRDVVTIKFHGALYHDSEHVPGLAQDLAGWCGGVGIQTLLAPAASRMAEAARMAGMEVLEEAFADRRYQWDKRMKRLSLVPRTQVEACINTVEEALDQCRHIALHGEVWAVNDSSAHPIRAQTLCIHSDSPIALELAQALAGEDWMHNAPHV